MLVSLNSLYIARLNTNNNITVFPRENENEDILLEPGQNEADQNMEIDDTNVNETTEIDIV